MLRGLLRRRQSSQSNHAHPSSSSLAFDDETSVIVSEPLSSTDIAYGDPTQDAGDEVRFSVELTRIDRLNDTYSLDIRRLKGNLRSYKFLYDTLRECALSLSPVVLFSDVNWIFADARTSLQLPLRPSTSIFLFSGVVTLFFHVAPRILDFHNAFLPLIFFFNTLS
jgi:hypothetical protein